ncbi:MAG: MarR family transcriptional regulator [Clostridiales bacterium]|nr:MarR family transcriptional regulator [Clostridiales bacterium]
MDTFTKELNELLVNTFWSILKVEEKMLKNDHNINLSINEFHLIETVGNDDAHGITVGEIAQKLQIAPPSVTVSINKLRTKGYVEKRRDQKDGRVVYVTLTELGQKINRMHQYFHARMVSDVARELTDEEREVLLSGLRKLSAFFNRRTGGQAE